MGATEPELIDVLVADGNAATISESTATPDLDAAVAERDRYYELLAEVLDDLEHVVNGNPGYIDRDMLTDYRERAGLPK